DLDLRMVRTEMALAAGFRLARLRLREAVSGMAGAAASPAAVGIDASDAGVGPRRRIELAARQHRDGRAGALEAAAGDRRRAAYHLAEEIVERGEDLAGAGMMAALLLVDLLLMTARAVLGRHDHGDAEAVVLEGVRIAGLGAMAVEAVHALLAVGAEAPLLREPRIHAGMAAEAGLALLGAPGPRGTRRRDRGLRRRGWRERLGLASRLLYLLRAGGHRQQRQSHDGQ